MMLGSPHHPSWGLRSVKLFFKTTRLMMGLENVLKMAELGLFTLEDAQGSFIIFFNSLKGCCSKEGIGLRNGLKPRHG